MKKLLLLVVMLTVASGVTAATLVLKGGKKLDVTGLQRQGNYVVVKYATGRVELYPVAAVDLPATTAANATPAAPAAPAPAASTGPHSPFFGAQANPGKPVVVVTDDDVQHVTPPDETEAAPGAKAVQGSQSEGQVTLIDYSKQKVDDGTWEITANVINSGGGLVSGVTAQVRLLDANGATIATGTGALAGNLAPSQQAAVTARIASPVEPVQIGFSFQWQNITPQPTPAPGAGAPAAATPAAKSLARNASAPAPAAAQPAGYTVPPGSSPNTLPTNPMAVPGNLTQPPTSLQVPRPTGDQKQAG